MFKRICKAKTINKIQMSSVKYINFTSILLIRTEADGILFTTSVRLTSLVFKDPSGLGFESIYKLDVESVLFLLTGPDVFLDIVEESGLVVSTIIDEIVLLLSFLVFINSGLPVPIN